MSQESEYTNEQARADVLRLEEAIGAYDAAAMIGKSDTWVYRVKSGEIANSRKGTRNDILRAVAKFDGSRLQLVAGQGVGGGLLSDAE